MIGEIGRLDRITERELDMLGEAASGRSVTRTIRVSPNGSNADGLSWRTAINSISDALDMASTDVNELTQIRIAPQTGNIHYDIDRTGDPTWSANVMLVGSHRTWVKIMNEHDTATSVMNFSGYASLIDLNINLGTSNNGIIFTKGAFRCKDLQFVGEDLTSTKTALHLDGASTIKHGKVVGCQFKGHTTYMTAILIDNCSYSIFDDLRIHECLKGIQFVNAGSISNYLCHIDIGDCDHVDSIALDIDGGTEQHFTHISLHHNTVNVDDEVDGHIWDDITGEFSITAEPDDLVGVTVTTGAAGAWGADTEIRAAVASTVPFRIVGLILEPSREEWFQIRLSADSGATFFDNTLFYGRKEKGVGAPSGTEFIFNADSRISCSGRSVTLTQTMKVWLKIQEI